MVSGRKKKSFSFDVRRVIRKKKTLRYHLPFHIKNIKYLGVNLIKGLYNEKYKTKIVKNVHKLEKKVYTVVEQVTGDSGLD